jgi:hypothetical protein
VSSNPIETVLLNLPVLNFERSFKAKSCKSMSFHLLLFNTHDGRISCMTKKLSFCRPLPATCSMHWDNAQMETCRRYGSVADDSQHPVASSNLYLPDVASANFILFPKIKELLGHKTLTKAILKSHDNGLSGPLPPKSLPPPFANE